MKVGLYFGTFNPIHVGHIIIANHLVEYSDLDEIWMVVTPHNPHKKKSSLLANHHRFELVYQALQKYTKIKPSDIEFKLPQPNYTVNTLAPGLHTVVVTDARGCTATGTIFTHEPDVLTVSITVLDSVYCNGTSTGTLGANPLGGTPFTSTS